MPPHRYHNIDWFWDDDTPDPGAGQVGECQHPSQWYNGKRPAVYRPRAGHFCGDLRAWEAGAIDLTTDPPLVHQPGGIPTCCWIGPEFIPEGGLCLSGSATITLSLNEEGAVGSLCLSGEATTNTSLDYITTGELSLENDTESTTTLSLGPSTANLEIEGQAHLNELYHYMASADFEIEGQAYLNYLQYYLATGELSSLGLSQEQLFYSWTTDAELDIEGTATVEDVPGDVGPGSTCEDAGTMEFGVTYQYTINPMEFQWWTFPVVSGHTYRVRYSHVSGDTGNGATLKEGTCALNNLVGPLPVSGCQQFTSSHNNFGFVTLNGSPMGSTTYEITADEGSCP